MSVSSYCKWKDDIPRSQALQKPGPRTLDLLRGQMGAPGSQGALGTWGGEAAGRFMVGIYGPKLHQGNSVPTPKHKHQT